jgi:achilleol B synthase
MIFYFFCIQVDLIYPRAMAQNLVWTCLNKVIEPMLNCWPVNKLRDIALKNIMEHIHYEDETSKYICTCPINKVIRINA